MVSVSSSRLSTGSRTERSTTSLIASRFRERCDPFWSGGRSTNRSSVVVSVSVRLGRRTWTGFTTPVTPTLLSRNEFVTFSPCTSFGMGSTRGALPSRRLKTCRSNRRMQWFRNRPSRRFRLPSRCSVLSGPSPTICTMTSRCLGLLSSSRKTTCCQVPRAAPPSTIGRVRLGPRNVARMWLWPFPSCHRALVPVLDRQREEPIQRLRDVLLHEAWFELVGDNRTRRRWREDAGEAVADTRSFNHFRDAVRDVDRLYPSAGLEGKRLPVIGHGAGTDSG